MSDLQDPGLLEPVIELLRQQTGHDFSSYKKSTIARRIEGRMGRHQLVLLTDYLRYLRENPHEAEVLFNELLIGVTRFFRDPAVWEPLKTSVMVAWLSAHPQGGVFRAWVPACSSGEEAYSLVMVFQEALEQVASDAPFSLQVFATDLDPLAVATARVGRYSRSIEAEVSAPRLRRFFVAEAGGYRVADAIRAPLVFAEQNIAVDPPFTKLNLLSCRNLLIYLEPELQTRLMALFHYSLNPGGFLLLGSAESPGMASPWFSALAGNPCLYQRRADAPRLQSLDFSAAPPRRSRASLAAQVEKMVLQRYAPTSVLVSPQGEMLYVCGKTASYLGPASGQPSLSLWAMLPAPLSRVVREALLQVLRESQDVTLKNIKVGEGRQARAFNITLQPVPAPASLRGCVLVVFLEQPRRRQSAAATDLLTQSLQEAGSHRDAMALTQEELTASDEELQSTNEELQSTNEELTRSRQEMQSMNEELQSLNQELQARLGALSQTGNDLKNLLESSDMAVLFLDAALQVRRFSEQASRLIPLLPGDVGRPVSDITSQLNYPEMADDAREVLHTLVWREREVPTHDARCFKVRLMPYRTQDNRIDGLVITLMEVTERLQLVQALNAAQGRLALLLASASPQEVLHGLP